MKNRVKITFKKFFRNKLNYIVLLLIGICFSFSIIVNSLSYSATKYYEENLLNWVDNRIFSIRIGEPDDKELEEKREKLQNLLTSMDEIQGVFSSYSYLSFWSFPELTELHKEWKEEVNVQLDGTTGTINATYGNDLTQSKDMEIICPSVYYPYENAQGIDKTKSIDLKPYVGKTLKLKFLDPDSQKEFNMKLVGLYDNDILNKNYRKCYTTAKTAEKITKEVIHYDNNYIYYELKNIIDEQKVTEYLIGNGYWPSAKVPFRNQIAIDSVKLLNKISFVIFIASIFIVLMIMYFNFIKNKKVLSLNRILGYSNKNIILNHVLESIILFIFSLISTAILSLIFLLLFRRLIPYYYSSFKYISILISPAEILNALIMIFIISILIGISMIIFSSMKGGDEYGSK